jgi:hypothetical protein
MTTSALNKFLSIFSLASIATTILIVDVSIVAGGLLWEENISSRVEQRNLSIAKELVGEEVSTNTALVRA